MLGNIASLGRKARAGFESFKRCQRGAVPALMGFTILGMMGFAGMGIDGANWYAQKRVSQNIVDAAAVAGAHAALKNDGGDEDAQMQEYAISAAVQNGYQKSNGNTLTVNPIPDTGQITGVIPRVEVVVVQNVPAYFAGILIDFQPKVAARAVGGILYTGKVCVVGLDPDDAQTVHFTGNNVTNVSCGIASNSESSQSFVVAGNATVDPGFVQAAGNIVVSGSGQLNTEDDLVASNHPPAPDPFGDRVFPDPPATCDITGNFSVSPNTQVLLQVTNASGFFKFCGDVSVRGDLDLTPGTYFFHESDLTVNSQASLTCSTCVGGAGVTLVFSGTGGNNIGDIIINGGATVDLRAPDSGDFAGLLVYKQPSNDETGTNRFNGGSTMSLNGGIYIPSEPLEYSGGNGLASCTVLVARKVSFTGTTTTHIQTNETVCNEVGLGDITSENQQRLVVLVE